MSVRSFELLTHLTAAHVEFIVVGGVAGLLHQAAVLTEDLDIVHRRSPDNIARLMDVLDAIEAVFRHDLAGRKLRPRSSDLAGRGHILLQTNLGMLDILCELSGERGYEELLPHAVTIADRELCVQVLGLPMLIEVKAEAGRPKDKVALPLLMAALEESKRRR